MRRLPPPLLILFIGGDSSDWWHWEKDYTQRSSRNPALKLVPPPTLVFLGHTGAGVRAWSLEAVLEAHLGVQWVWVYGLWSSIWMVEEVLLYKPNLSTPRSNSGGRHHMVTHLGHAFQSCFTNNTADILINIQLPCLLLNWYCAYRGKIDVINYHLQKPVSNTFVNYGLPLLPSINISAQHRQMFHTIS